MYIKTMTITYAQAKLAAIDETATDWRFLRDASSFLLSRLNASNEDISDAHNLVKRAITLQCAELRN